MSIFKSTFSPFVKTQLDIRQNAMSDRTTNSLQYYNSRNAWIRMSSSVNVNGSADLAKNYILQGGTLTKDKKLKSGLGDFSNTYSNRAYDGNPYRLGIRPMPGITSLEIKSKSAYGSLREATVSFQCWDIKQLEDLELLYMRPGYTVLVEWGWAPYLDNDKKYQPTFTDYYDIIDKPPTERTVLFKELYERSKKHGGNYDAIFGYIKNYQWSARMDGGYDCQVSVISTGEIIESLKVNYLTPKAIADNRGLLGSEFASQGNTYKQWGGSYTQNILAGVWAETYHKISDPAILVKRGSIFENNNLLGPNTLKLFDPSKTTSTSLPGHSREIYITLQCMVDILNKYVIAKGSDKQPLIRLSLDSTDYDDTTKSDLLCIAHPLQVSINPSVCLIKSPLWGSGEIISQAAATATSDPSLNIAQSIVDKIIAASVGDTTDENTIEQQIKLINSPELYNKVKQLLSQKSERYNTLEKIFNEELDEGDELVANQIIEALKKINVNVSYRTKGQETALGTARASQEPGFLAVVQVAAILATSPTPSTAFLNTSIKKGTFRVDDTAISNSSAATAASQVTIAQSSPQALRNISFINSDKLKDYFYENTYSEIGVIKNIYVNVNFLYQQALDTSLQSADPKEKNEISLFNYLKKIVNAIQSAMGNVNNFEIHVDPVDNNVARIIDVNYTEHPRAKYNDLFELKIQTLGSVIRSYNLQSQIFPEQSSIVAIGAQAKGGSLGVQSNTMIDFNRNITDRILPKKTDAQESDLEVDQSGNNFTANITNALSNIIKLFDSLDGSTSVDLGSGTDISSLIGPAQNSLKDLIVYFQSITRSPGSNRNLIPTKFSCEMDGIGGMVIGHMFRLPENIMPKGYRGVDGVGVQLGNAVTSIGHSISNGDWVTKIDSLNIVMDNPKGIEFKQLNLELIKTALESTLTGQIPSIDIPNVPNIDAASGNANTPSTNNSSSPTAYNVAENSQKYPVLVKSEAFKSAYNATVQRYAKVSASTPVADALRNALDNQYITEKGSELSSNGDITEALKSAVLTFQSKLKSTAGFEFIKNNPIVITAGNDEYHRKENRRDTTTHCRGLAIDIRTQVPGTGADVYTRSQRDSIISLLKASGFSYVIYHGPVYHIHANLPTS